MRAQGPLALNGNENPVPAGESGSGEPGEGFAAYRGRMKNIKCQWSVDFECLGNTFLV